MLRPLNGVALFCSAWILVPVCPTWGLRSGWHIDGSFQQKPFKIQTMHFWSISKDGHTHFSPLRELLESLSDDIRGRWDRYWFVGDRVVHPLTYNHPTTGERTMVFHCGGYVRQLRHHFGTIYRACSAPTHHILSVCRGLLVAHADRELIGAWNPQLGLQGVRQGHRGRL